MLIRLRSTGESVSLLRFQGSQTKKSHAMKRIQPNSLWAGLLLVGLLAFVNPALAATYTADFTGLSEGAIATVDSVNWITETGGYTVTNTGGPAGMTAPYLLAGTGGDNRSFLKKTTIMQTNGQSLTASMKISMPANGNKLGIMLNGGSGSAPNVPGRFQMSFMLDRKAGTVQDQLLLRKRNSSTSYTDIDTVIAGTTSGTQLSGTNFLLQITYTAATTTYAVALYDITGTTLLLSGNVVDGTFNSGIIGLRADSPGTGAFLDDLVITLTDPAPTGIDHFAVAASSPQTAGAAFDVTITAQDVGNATISDSSTTVAASSPTPGNLVEFDWNSDGTYGDNSGTLVAGVKTIKARDKKAETVSLRATAGATTTTSPPSVTINPGAFAKLQLLVPGETAAPGTTTGKTGTSSARTLGGAFNVTVNAVDAYWNLVNTVGDTVAITSTDGTATLPASAPLGSGTGSFSVTLNSAGNFTITATDSSDGGKSPDTSPAIAVSLPSGATIVWQGDNSLNQWNISAVNWTNTSGTPVAFAAGDKVIFDDTGSAGPDVNITVSVLPTSVTVSNLSQNYTLGGSGKITYTTGLVKAGGGSLTLVADNDFTGNVALNGGTLRLGNGGTTGALGSGTVNVGGSGTVLAFNRSDSIVVTNRITGGSTTVPMIQAEAGTVTIGGTTDNSFAVATVKSGATMILAKASSGTVHALGNGGTVEAGGTLKLGGTGGDQIFVWGDLTVNGLFDLNGLGETFDGLSGSGTVDNTGVAAVTMGVGADNSTTTFAGTIQNTGGSLAVTKSGNGTLTLTGTSSYGGVTTISSGSLLVDGTLNGVGNVAVNGSATLGGSGTIGGGVSVTANAKLAPGNAGVGTLTVNSNLTLAGSTLIQLDKGLSPANDKINATGTLTYGGTLNVTNIGAAALVGGDTFPIFPAGGSGSVSVVGDAGPGLSFSFNPATGVLSVVGAGGSPTLNYTSANNIMTFSWTGAYKLMWQTNALNVGLSTNWVDYPDASNPVNVTINPVIKSAFFGLAPQ
jgi:autotransporter-associated beta strand protein